MDARRLILAVGAVLLLVPATARGRGAIGGGAQGKGGLDAACFGLNAVFGFGGELDIDAETTSLDLHVDDDLEPTLGFALWGDYGVHEYVNVGGEARFIWVITDDMEDVDWDRSTVIDLAAHVRAGSEVLSGLTLFGRVPFGLSIGIPDDDWSGEDAELDTAAGLNIGVLAGAAYDIAGRIGLLLELGYLHHVLWGEAHGRAGGKADMTYDFGQFHLAFGATF